MARKILSRIPTSLAEDGIWNDPTEILLIHHNSYGFNGARVSDVIEIFMATEDDVEFLDNGYDDCDDDVDPGDLSDGTGYCIAKSDLRSLAASLIAAADELGV